MTTDTTNLLKMRKSFLEALNDPQSDTGLLKDMLKELKAAYPGIVVAYGAEDEQDAIGTTPSSWNEQYFSRQKKLAERNFSQERLEHLMQVRELFRQQGRKGFVPGARKAAVDPAPALDNGYSPSTNLRKFVDEGDVPTIRMALTVELEDSRRDARTMRAALAWAKSRVPGLCEPYAEKAFARAVERDRQQWTEDYYGTQAVYLDTNFSEERFLHLVDVREHLRQQGAAKPAAPAAPTRPAAPARAPASAPRPAAQPAVAAARPAQPPHRSPPPPARPGMSPVMIAALLIGGALAVVVILMLAFRK
ncbi:hypothetical protein ACI48D_20250 [Massilia sp. LXY-6]|uniref:hypothetical protein n=1 Tax=Massilia sp. LXY-6 TaxID=3379823 RepID=UPI003EE395D8